MRGEQRRAGTSNHPADVPPIRSDNIAGKLATCWSAIKSITTMRCCLLQLTKGRRHHASAHRFIHRRGELIRVISAVKRANA
jgi:hypothetical protein